MRLFVPGMVVAGLSLMVLRSRTTLRPALRTGKGSRARGQCSAADPGPVPVRPSETVRPSEEVGLEGLLSMGAGGPPSAAEPFSAIPRPAKGQMGGPAEASAGEGATTPSPPAASGESDPTAVPASAAQATPSAGNAPTRVASPAGWHPDPAGRYHYRWWDGDQWTAHVSHHGQSFVDPSWPTVAPVPAVASTGAGPAVVPDGSAGSATLSPPSWHPDPSGRFHYRWWDGSQWTSYVSVNGQQLLDTNPDQRIGPYPG